MDGEHLCTMVSSRTSDTHISCRAFCEEMHSTNLFLRRRYDSNTQIFLLPGERFKWLFVPRQSEIFSFSNYNHETSLSFLQVQLSITEWPNWVESFINDLFSSILSTRGRCPNSSTAKVINWLFKFKLQRYTFRNICYIAIQKYYNIIIIHVHKKPIQDLTLSGAICITMMENEIKNPTWV